MVKWGGDGKFGRWRKEGGLAACSVLGLGCVDPVLASHVIGHRLSRGPSLGQC
jgi:hypothetical protein